MEDVETEKLVSRCNLNLLRAHSRRVLVCALIITMISIIYFGSQKIGMSSSVSQTLYSQTGLKNASNQNGSSPSRIEFEVVLSYYAEDINHVARFIQYLRNTSTLQKRKSRITVYNKNSAVNNTQLQSSLKADVVYQLPNFGREGGTYLHHIIENYLTLSDHILFSQAGVEGITDTGLADWFYDRLENQFKPSVGYMPLVENQWFAIFDCGIKPHENQHRLAELWGVIEQTLCPPGGQSVAFRGQFLVSGKRIRTRPLRIYKYINELLMANHSHWIHSDSRSTFFVPASTPDNPQFGHVLERLWTTLFNCTRSDLLIRCVQKECACLD